jgi:transposase
LLASGKTCTNFSFGAGSVSKKVCIGALQVQEVLRRDPLSGHLFCFCGRRGDLLKVIWHDG